MFEVPYTVQGEEWRPALQVEGVLVSNMGRCYRMPTKVRRFNFGKPELRSIPGGIVKTNQISVGGKVYTVMDLVATAWIGPKPKDKHNLVVRFVNGNNRDRRASNLVWAVRNNKEQLPTRCFTSDGRPFKLDRENVGRVR